MLSRFAKCCTLLLSFSHAISAVSYKAGSTVNVDGIYYYISADSVSTLGTTWTHLKAAASSGEDFIPMTVMEGDFSVFDSGNLDSQVESFQEDDDVFNTGFLQAIYLISTTSTELHTSITSSLAKYKNKLLMVSSTGNSTVSAGNSTASASYTVKIPNGPYFLHVYTGEVFKAYRLYSDVEGAFTEGTIDHPDGNFSTLSASVPGVQSSTIGVPSRLYYTKTVAKPLAGVRLGIKDIFDMPGTKRGCGNRDYLELYPARNTTAPAVQKLMDAGAVIVGRMKTSQFANGERATADWVDYHSPFNARGDGYSDPSSSSSGPGAGIGAYSWLDLALGSDTGGSVRNPAQVNGAYGNRPTHDLVSLNNTMPLSPLLDTAGLLTRDATLWKTAAHILYTNMTTFTKFPSKLYTTGFPTNASNEAEGVLLTFLSKLEAFLSVNSSVLDYDSMWASSSQAANASAPTLSDLLALTYPTLISKQQYNLFGLPFIRDFAAANDGRYPFLDPNPAVRWAFAATNATTLEQGIYNKTLFMDWWNDEVVLPHPESCSDSLLLYPGTLATPAYRNEYFPAPSIPAGWGVYNIAIFAEVPDMVFPLGEAPYNSTITRHEEYLPVAVDVIAAKGCDAVIFELAEQLQKAGIINAPNAGSRMYRRDIGANLE